jgi:glycosyltransferase involved in cell wall biosynthesis
MDKKEKIIFINQSAGYLMVDIINAYKNKYKKAILIVGKLVIQDAELDPYASIDKIIGYNRSSTFLRIYSWLVGTIQIFFLILFKYRTGDLFIVTNPPFSPFLPLFFKNKFSLLIYDIFPDVLYHKIIKENSVIAKCWKKINKKVYHKAAYIFTLSEGMASALSQYTDRNKIRVVPNWTNTSFLCPIDKDKNTFIKEHKIESKFIVLYSGNMGTTHNIETIINIANKLKDEKDILFLLIGEGAKKKKIENMIVELVLKNCLMLPFQKSEIIPFSLSSADIGIVTLDEKIPLVSVPSKTYNLMAVGATLLCIGGKKSELNNLIEQYQIGKIFDTKSEDEMVSFILNVKNNKDIHSFYSSNARKASQNFTSQNAFLYIE